jgi:hypothetical protein
LSARSPAARRIAAASLAIVCTFAPASLAPAFASPARGTQQAQAVATQAQARGARVSLRASFTPDRLGAETTVRLALRISPAPGQPAQPVTGIGLRYPAQLGFADSELGLATCRRARLQARGWAGCPHDSLMGEGSALVEVPFASRAIVERAPLRIFSEPVQHDLLGLLFAARGRSPVIADLVFGATVREAAGPFGGLIDTTLPLVPTAPKGPDVALLALQTTLGPPGLRYSERDASGHLVTFKPKRMLLGVSCPRGGYPFAASVRFADGSTAKARISVPCPHLGRNS